MFYCDKCRQQLQWPEGFSKSAGPCEICGVTAVCYEVPASRLPPLKPVVLYNTVEEEYVSGWEGETLREYTLTPYKALAQVFMGQNFALKDLNETIELEENRQPYTIVDAQCNDEEQAVGALMKLKPEQRIDVLREFCEECGEPHSPKCRRDLDLA